MFKRELLFQQIAKILRQEIGRVYLPGEKIPGDHDLARRFDVSVVTVRQALMLLMNEGRLERRQGSGTRVCQQLPMRHIALYTEQDVLDRRLTGFVPAVLRELRDFLAGHHPVKVYAGNRNAIVDGTDVPPSYLRPPSCETFVNAVEANELAGVVLVATDPHDSWEKQLVEQHVPLVGTSPRCACSVSNDVDLGVRQAVERLAQRGRKRIALLDWHHSEKEESLINSVRCGFKETLASLGLPCQPHWISGEVNPVRIGVGWQSFREIWTSSQEKPDALIVADDCLFQDVVSAICQMGIHVPQTLDLITNANAGIELYAPFPFTRMQYDPAATAEALGKMLLEQMAGGQQSTGKSLWLEPQWFESSGMFIKGPQSQQVYEQR